MFSLRRPTDTEIRRQIDGQSRLGFTYEALGSTATTLPQGFVVDHTRAAIGSTAVAFEAGVEALRQWRQFQQGWMFAAPANTPLEPGATVAVAAWAMGLWTTSCARVVYTVDEEVAGVRRFGFAYGTLPGHVESGEERFLVEWDPRSDQVYFDILAFSRPRHWLVRLSYPLARRLQRRFGREAVAS